MGGGGGEEQSEVRERRRIEDRSGGKAAGEGKGQELGRKGAEKAKRGVDGNQGDSNLRERRRKRQERRGEAEFDLDLEERKDGAS